MRRKSNTDKAILEVVLFLLISLTFTGCRKEAYSFQNSVDKIDRIEIVSAENSLEFTVTQVLSEAEKEDFLEQFQMIQFDSYYIGDPMSVNGEAIKITYQDGDYEMICYYWSEYVRDGEIYYVRKSCDERDFHKLLGNFSE